MEGIKSHEESQVLGSNLFLVSEKFIIGKYSKKIIITISKEAITVIFTIICTLLSAADIVIVWMCSCKLAKNIKRE